MAGGTIAINTVTYTIATDEDLANLILMQDILTQLKRLELNLNV